MTSKRQRKAARALVSSPKQAAPKERKSAPPRRPLPLVIEGYLVEQCQGPADVRKKAKIQEKYRLTRTKAGTYLLHFKSEKDREEALSRPDQKESVIRPTRKQESGSARPYVVITNFPTMWEASNITPSDGESYTRLKASKSGQGHLLQCSSEGGTVEGGLLLREGDLQM